MSIRVRREDERMRDAWMAGYNLGRAERVETLRRMDALGMVRSLCPICGEVEVGRAMEGDGDPEPDVTAHPSN